MYDVECAPVWTLPPEVEALREDELANYQVRTYKY